MHINIENKHLVGISFSKEKTGEHVCIYIYILLNTNYNSSTMTDE